MLTSGKFNELIQFVQRGFAVELAFEDDETAFAAALAAFKGFSDEWENNLLNTTRKSKLPYLEGLFFKLEQFARFMPPSNRDIEYSLVFKGLGFLFNSLLGSTPLEKLANELSADQLSDVQTHRLRSRLEVEDLDGFATFNALDMAAHQQLLAAQLVQLSWLTLTPAYTQLGGIAKPVPRKQRWEVKIETSIRDDLRRFVPEMREMTAQSHPTEEDVYTEWGRHLTSIRWRNHPPHAGSWQAPVEYEQAFHGVPDKAAFIAGFCGLINAIEPILNLPDEENPLFMQDNSHLVAGNREKQRRQSLHHARVNAKRMLQWLQARQKPAALQLLEALEYVVLVPEWSSETWSPTDILTVADFLPEDEMTLRFEMLLRRFRDDMPTAPSELNILSDRLNCLIRYPATVIAQADFRLSESVLKIADLVRVVPQLILVDQTPDITKQPAHNLAGDFWVKLEVVINARLPWAQRALELTLVAVAKPPNDKVKPALSLMQVAILCYYNGMSCPGPEEANSIASEHGHNSGKSLRNKYNLYIKGPNRMGTGEISVPRLIADTEAVIPYLKYEQLERAHNDLEALKA